MVEDRLSESTEFALDQLREGFLLDCLNYWKSRTGEHFAPSWKDIELMALPMKAIPFVVVVDVKAAPEDFVYRFWGTGHVSAKGIDRTGKSVHDHPQGRSIAVLTEYRRVVAEKRPIGFGRRLMLPDGRQPIDQTALRMPLTSDGENVDKIISVTDWWNARDYWMDRVGQPPRQD